MGGRDVALSDIDLNSPIKRVGSTSNVFFEQSKENNVDTWCLKAKEDRFCDSTPEYSNQPPSIESERNEIHRFLQNPCVDLADKVHLSSRRLYQIYLRKHQIKRIREFTKQHMLVIIKLIGLGGIESAEQEILSLYNETNLEKIETLDQVLLADFSISNRHYLSTLKLLVMQLIIKGKTHDKHSAAIIRLFAYDSRYLLRNEKTKVQPLIKLLLNFFSVLPTYKILFGLKFLQYIKQFALCYGDFVKNMPIQQFQELLSQWGRKSFVHICDFLNLFYVSYSKHFFTVDKIMLHDIVETAHNDRMKPLFCCFDSTPPHQWEQQLKSLSPFSSAEKTSLIDFVAESLKGRANNFPKLMPLLMRFLKICNKEFVPAPKEVWRIVDRITILINTHLKLIDMHVSKEIMGILSDFCINNLEPKRLLNIVNVGFNSFIIFKNEIFLFEAAKLEIIRQVVLEDGELCLSRLEKFISNASKEYRIKLFAIFFNIFTCFKYETLASLMHIMIQFSRSVRHIRSFSSEELLEASELMLCLLSTNQSLAITSANTWSPLTQKLFLSLSDFKGTNDIEIKSGREPLDPLRAYEPLVMSMYYLGLEIKKGSCASLAKITDAFIKEWVQRPSPMEEPVSLLELSLVDALFGFLKFNKFYKKVVHFAHALKESYFDSHENCADFVLGQLIEGYAGLQLRDCVITASAEIESRRKPCGIDEMSEDEFSQFTRLQLIKCFWKKDVSTFNQLFIEEIPKVKPEVFDVNNTSRIPTKAYLGFLILNIRITNTASALQLYNDNMVEALIEAKKSLKLCQTLLKKAAQLRHSVRWDILTFLNKSFSDVIEIYTHIGVSKDCDFYTTEYLRVACSIKDAVIVHECLQKSVVYYRITLQNNLAGTLTKKANAVFGRLDGSENFEALALFLFNNGEIEKLHESLNLFFKNYFRDSFLYASWKLTLGCTIDATHEHLQFAKANDINYSKEIYSRISSQMESDPFFRSMRDSVTSIPSFALRISEKKPEICIKGIEFNTPVKNRTRNIILNSPRPSSLTPRGKSLKQSFDRAKAANDLELIKRKIEFLDVEGMKSYEIAEASALYSLSLSLISSISASKACNSVLDRKFALAELPKYTPLYFEKLLSKQGNEIYSSFIPKRVQSKEQGVKKLENPITRVSLPRVQSTFALRFRGSFNVISLDVCDITGDLLLSKMESSNESKLCLRLPLNRSNSRDVDEIELSFDNAVNELTQIIKESNRTTSIEVTSTINTKDARKQWWQYRYELDSKLQSLLSKIESSWFSGFKTFFAQEIVEREHLENFRVCFEEILQQTLPTRKQCGNPSDFFRIDDVVLEMFLKLNPADKNFMEMMEDLIFFVFDLLLFHGEENAYDEIDTDSIHVQLESLINDYRKEVPSPKKLSHTFLVVCSAGHMIPWESLNFLASNSVSRIPCFQALRRILDDYSESFPPTIELDERLSMVLNPHGDLQRTQSNFDDIFREWSRELPGSNLVIGEKPEESKFVEMLNNSKAFIYVGHGGGEQYVRLKKIKQQDNIAPSFLLGCSSAFMESRGKLEPSGVSYSYLLGGCPMVVGNLWDVTDKDIDKFSTTMFEELGLIGGSKSPKTVSEALAVARGSCQLKYLNGAAPIMYGIPLRFIR
ncbi:LAQU0S10e04104g1_1 [Lachancea quebecensis]|uniref:separase n=1 Tax=Lachancea quebecensis TaxID=1654605 RepID=A0A0P1KWC7_9SACH|nr:LAQU0S10e04104g1_1 [Lachancea quebecensis]